MSCINIVEIQVLNNPSYYLSPFVFEISFESIKNLSEDLEWKVIYVGSSESEEYDQVLDSVMVGPIGAGTNKFTFQCDPPNYTKIPPDDILGVTVLLLTCSYKGVEFVRVGYYVNNEYENAEENQENETSNYKELKIEKVVRSILADKPRVTRFAVEFD